MSRGARFVVMFGTVVLVVFVPLAVPVKLLCLVCATLMAYGLPQGRRILAIGSPMLAAVAISAYIPSVQRPAGFFILSYLVALFLIGLVGYGKLTISVWRLVSEVRGQLRASRDSTSFSSPSSLREVIDRRSWQERVVDRMLR